MITDVFFDLDGTLTDPALGITSGVKRALAAFGVDEPDLKALEKFIGPPLLSSFVDFYGFSTEQAKKAVDVFRVYYQKTGIYENKLFNGIPQLLNGLVKQGKTLHVATSKPQVMANQVLKHFNIRDYFFAVHGTPLEHNFLTKGDVVRAALTHAKLSPLQTIMVGDRNYDVIGAKENGIATVGVLFGYGDEEELQAAGAAHIAASISELGNILSRL